MDKKAELGLDFIIDKLTYSIENVITGDSFQTEISILQKTDLKSITKKNGWLFSWSEEFKNPVKDIYKLTIAGNSTIIQGLVSLEVKSDHVFMHLLENAPQQRTKQSLHWCCWESSCLLL